MFRDHGPGIQFVGQPSPRSGAGWDELTELDTSLSATKRNPLSMSIWDCSAENGLYRAGLEVLHSQHCVDKLRRTIVGYLYFVCCSHIFLEHRRVPDFILRN
jgi:hypothetical protein